MLIKVACSTMLFAHPQMLVFSIAGGVLSWAIMAAAHKSGLFSTISVSVLGGIAHNAGQLIMVALVLSPTVALVNAPVLAVAGIDLRPGNRHPGPSGCSPPFRRRRPVFKLLHLVNSKPTGRPGNKAAGTRARLNAPTVPALTRRQAVCAAASTAALVAAGLAGCSKKHQPNVRLAGGLVKAAIRIHLRVRYILHVHRVGG